MGDVSTGGCIERSLPTERRLQQGAVSPSKKEAFVAWAYDNGRGDKERSGGGRRLSPSRQPWHRDEGTGGGEGCDGFHANSDFPTAHELNERSSEGVTGTCTRGQSHVQAQIRRGLACVYVCTDPPSSYDYALR